MFLRHRYAILTSFAFLLTFLSIYFYRSGGSFNLLSNVSDHPPPPRPIYKTQSTFAVMPIVDNFPLAASAQSAAELPPIPSWNAPPNPHVEESTPLFIGFTRNWRILQQVVLSYITSGWPAEDIYVVENTGVMDSNALGVLSLQNPFFLNHTRLQIFGVNILRTPTLLTFAQLQNFYLSTATDKAWAHYFWSHMDVVALSLESSVRFPPSTITASTPLPSDPDSWENHTIYTNCLLGLRNVTSSPTPWANIFFSYDRLALVNVAAYKSIGAWDTLIPFYGGDCDMHSRLMMAGYEIVDWKAGLIYDVGSTLEDLESFYRQKQGPKGEAREATWKDPNDSERGEKDEGKNEQNSNEPVNRMEGNRTDEDDHHRAWTLAALFTPYSKTSSPPTPSPQPKPDSKLWIADTPSSPSYTHLTDLLDHMQIVKNSNDRNTWQARQSGGQGEPFYRDSAGFEKGIQMTMEHGRTVYREKWGHRDCDIYEVGLRADDAWKVEHDWD